jgi:hypothetical protein
MNFITGEKLQSLAQLVIGTKKQIKFHKNFNTFTKNYLILENQKDIILNLEEIKKYKIIFIYGDNISFFFDNVITSLENIVLITHNGDNGVKQEFYKFLNYDNIIKWYGVNIQFAHPKLVALPIGIANSQWKHGNLHLLKKIMDKNNNKDNLLFINFSIKTNPNKRKDIKNILSKKFTIFDKKLTQEEYLDNLSKHKFSISPPGNGIDCHRTWESLYLGVIPIVENHPHNLQFQDLPILIINDWNNINEEYLMRIYHEFKHKKFNLDKLNFEYWEKIINLNID